MFSFPERVWALALVFCAVGAQAQSNAYPGIGRVANSSSSHFRVGNPRVSFLPDIAIAISLSCSPRQVATNDYAFFYP